MQNSALKLYPILCILLCSLTFTALARPLPVNAQNTTTQKTDDTSPTSQVDSKTGTADKKSILSDAVDAITDQDPLALALKNIELTMGENGFEVWRLKAQWASMKEADGSIEVLKPQIVYSMDEQNTNAAANSAAQAPEQTMDQITGQVTEQTTGQSTGSSSAEPGKESASPRTNATAGAPGTKLPQVPDKDDENIILVTAEKGIVRQKDKLITLEGDVNAVRGTSRLTGPRMIYDGQARSITFTDGMHFSGEGVTGQASRGGWDLKGNIITADGGVNLIYYAPMPEALKRTDKSAETATPKIDEDKAGQKAASTVKKQATPQPTKAKAQAKPFKKPVKNNKKKSQASSVPKS